MNFFWVVLTIVIISTVVGAIAKVLNNANEMNAPRPRPPARPGGGEGAAANAGGGAVRPASSDMDRFLAEIDRLRKKSAEAAPPPSNQGPAVPVVQPTKQPDRPRPRVVAELVEQPPRQDQGFTVSPPGTGAGSAQPDAGGLSLPAVTTPPSGTGAPATRVTRLPSRPRPVAKTPFAKNLTAVLNSGQGLALAVVLQEVLGPPKSRAKG